MSESVAEQHRNAYNRRKSSRDTAGWAFRVEYEDGRKEFFAYPDGYLYVWLARRDAELGMGQIGDGYGARDLGIKAVLGFEEVEVGRRNVREDPGTIMTVNAPAAGGGIVDVDVAKLLEENKKLRAILAYHGFRVP